MAVVLSFIPLLLNIVIILYEYQRRSTSLFLWATLLVMFSVFHFVSVASAFLDYPLWVYNEASLFVIIFDLLYLFIRMITKNKGYRKAYYEKGLRIRKVLSSEKKMFYLLWIMLLATIGMVLYNSYKSTGSILASSWGAFLNYSREQDYVNTNRLLAPFFYPAASLLFICKFFQPWKKYFWIVVLLLIFNVFVTRNRIEVLPILCFMIILYVANSRLTIKSLLLCVLGGGLVLYVVYGLQVYRYYGTIGDFIENATWSTFNTEVLSRILNQDGELGLRRAFYYFIFKNNNFDGFGEGHTYLRMLLFWLPTSWSGGLKPDDFAIAMGKAWRPSSWGYSMHPTLYGDCYANFGAYGVFMGAFWAVFVNVSDYITSKSSVMLQYICVMCFSCSYVIIGRGSVYNAFILLISGLLVLYMLNRVLLKKI